MSNNTNSPAFDEGRLTTDPDPLNDLNAQDFPFDEICLKLDGDDGNGDARMSALVEALKVFLFWAAEPFKRRSDGDAKLRETGKRLVAALWVLDPACFKEGPISAAELSRQIGNNRVAISECASEFTRRFKVRNRYQANGRNGKHADKLRASIENQRPEAQ
jgi:hypothetical protein